jgi:hypothetical protein
LIHDYQGKAGGLSTSRHGRAWQGMAWQGMVLNNGVKHFKKPLKMALNIVI